MSGWCPPYSMFDTQELTARSYCHIHLLNLQDGSTHHPGLSNITWGPPPGAQCALHDETAVAGSRVAIHSLPKREPAKQWSSMDASRVGL